MLAIKFLYTVLNTGIEHGLELVINISEMNAKIKIEYRFTVFLNPTFSRVNAVKHMRGISV